MTTGIKENSSHGQYYQKLAKGSQLSQVIKVTNHIEADETVAAQPDTLYKSGPFYIG